jgi:hypothetical protein
MLDDIDRDDAVERKTVREFLERPERLEPCIM